VARSSTQVAQFRLVFDLNLIENDKNPGVSWLLQN